MRFFKALPAIVASTLLCSALASAQASFGRLAGTVFDETGGVLPAATVTLINELTGQQTETTTTETGAFLFPLVQPGSYTVTVSLAGFRTAQFTQVEINVGAERSLTVRLEVGALTETLSVSAGGSLVQTTTPEVTQTVVQRQIVDLPLDGRNPIELITLQAGVPGIVNRTATAVNGGRPTWTQLTLDGINIQDNFIRENALNFSPNRPTADIVGELTITTAVPGADAAGGATAVRLITPSGTNRFQGNVFGFNRTNRRAANSFFNERSGLPAPEAQSKPVRRQARRADRAKPPVLLRLLRGLPAADRSSAKQCHPRARRFRTRRVSLHCQRRTGARRECPGSRRPATRRHGATRHPREGANGIEREQLRCRQFRGSQTTQHGGVSLPAGEPERSTPMGAADRLRGNSRTSFRSQLRLVPLRRTTGAISMVSTRVRSCSPTRRCIDTLERGAGARQRSRMRCAAGAILRQERSRAMRTFGDAMFSLPLITDRITSFQPEGRDSRIFQYSDTGSWVRRDHELQFGGQLQQIRVNPYAYAGRLPEVGFGFSPAAPARCSSRLPSSPEASAPLDLAAANSWLAFLSGTVSAVARRSACRIRRPVSSPGFRTT